MQIQFIKYSKVCLLASIGALVLGLILILTKGFSLGIDFAGGSEIQVRFTENVSEGKLRSFLKEQGFGEALVQSFGEENEILIRIQKTETQKIKFLSESFKQKWKGAQIRRVDSVGPQIGDELKKKGIIAVFYSLLLILIYLALRFDYKYAPSAVFCLFHDAILTMAVFSLFEREVNVQTLAGVLAIIGYSLNDTIVTFDRVRENAALYSRKKSFAEICNLSLNHVLSRTLLTSLTTLLAVGAMWFLTAGVIRDFAFTLGIGVFIGTYSSIYVAVPLTIFFDSIQKSKKASIQ